MKTHVSYDGYLQHIRALLDTVPYGSRFVSYGRLVNPKGSYVDAKVVGLYQTDDGFVAVG